MNLKHCSLCIYCQSIYQKYSENEWKCEYLPVHLQSTPGFPVCAHHFQVRGHHSHRKRKSLPVYILVFNVQTLMDLDCISKFKRASNFVWSLNAGWNWNKSAISIPVLHVVTTVEEKNRKMLFVCCCCCCFLFLLVAWLDKKKKKK